jgi:hypothetical protein
LSAFALAVAIVVWRTRPNPSPAEPPRAAASGTQHEGANEVLALSSGEDRPERDEAPTAAGRRGPETFEGRGVIRGKVVAQGGAAMPERWTLLLEPHPWLEGSEKAERRRIEFERGETTFRADDLPMGGYLVRAVAGGLNDLPASVLLVRGSADQFVTVALRPGGFLEGSLLDAAGRPAEGLDVTLDSIETRARATVTTDAAGGFLFRDVQDGEYEIRFGRADSPLLPVERVAFKAPSLRFPPRTLPATGTVKIKVIDLQLRPQPRARISGSNADGNSVDVFADHLGRATIRHMLPGRYVLDLSSEDGLEGHATFDLAADQELDLELLVRQRRTPR